jgi:IS5 family transposase
LLLTLILPFTSASRKLIARIDHHSWDAFHEGNDLPEQVESFHERYGHYPEVVMADNIYGTRSNRAYLKDKGIRFAGKPLGRPPKESAENAEQLKADKKQREKEYRQRIPIEGKFGQGKGAYRMNYIRAKRSDTSISWVNGIFFVMNLLVLFKWYFLSLILILKRLSKRRFRWSGLHRATVLNDRMILQRPKPSALVAV